MATPVLYTSSKIFYIMLISNFILFFSFIVHVKIKKKIRYYKGQCVWDYRLEGYTSVIS